MYMYKVNGWLHKAERRGEQGWTVNRFSLGVIEMFKK